MIKISIQEKSECCGASFVWVTCDECGPEETHDFKKCSECWDTLDD
jgi:predicted amidophosphoribosyltransferase